MKPANFPHFAALVLILITLNSVSAGQQPCTQPLTLPSATEPNIFSDEQEIYLGDAIAARIQNQYHVIEAPEITDYLTKIGERLTKHLPINRLRFQFFLVDLPDANAFVIPGGRIFVSRKLVAAAVVEDELAGVIAHELGHLVVHQSAIDTTRQFKALGITSVTDRNDIFEKYNRLIDNINQKPGAFKIQDREKGQLFADQAGMFALVAAGYDAEAMSRFWDRITETQGKKGSWLTDFFGTTRPEQKRLREMVKATESLPAECRQKVAASQSEAWLALSGRSRGGVWNVGGKGEAVLALRDFQGGYLSDDGYFFGEFPKTEDVERNVARFNLSNGEAVAGPKIEGDSSHQYGQYLFTIKSAKAAEKPPESDNAPKINPAEYRRNVVIEMFDARTMKSLWSQAFPKEAPRVWIAPGNQTMALLWSVTADAAKSEINADPQLTQTLARMKEKVGDYFLKIVDAQSGKEIGKRLIETGKASFRVSNIFAAGDSVIVTDTQNRVLVYSLKTGEQKGRVFGAYAAVSPASKLLCVENESGKLAVYDLATMEKRDEFIFTRPISMLRFSQDGKRLFVLTVGQTVYILDMSPIAKA